ncbi:acetate kinase, partial [Candidatus Woesearchaeota archaeon]|nr:acetate kinase [Candidatus Woesearchaeota archaeon]
MKILTINSGSSSLKYKLFDMSTEKAIISGHVDGIGLDRCKYKLSFGGSRIEKKIPFKDHVDAIIFSLKSLKEYGAVKDFSEIRAVGHRVVHGGEYYSGPVLIDSTVIRRIGDLSDIAPLHNPPNLAGILACRKILKSTPQIACFDTAFHQTLKEDQYMYPLPRQLYTKYKIRRYGFHGLSHKFVSQQAIKLLGKKESKIITCHLGNGSSITAVQNGKSIATSMGFTPLEGLIMGTRSGSIDPAILCFLLMRKAYTPLSLNKMLNKESGLLGLSGLTQDVRDLRKKAREGNLRAKLAIRMLAERVAFFIAGYTAFLGGLDAIVFTAGIGEGAYSV